MEASSEVGATQVPKDDIADLQKPGTENDPELAEKKRLEFEALLHAQRTGRETKKELKVENIKQNKDPQEMMLVIQKTFREKYDAINKSVEEFKEGTSIDQLFESFNELKEYFVNTNYSLTSYDKQLYKEQLEKLEKSLQECKEKNQPRKKFAFGKKLEKKKEPEQKEVKVAEEETTQADSLSMIKGIVDKKGENLTLNQADLEPMYKLQNLEDCTINVNGNLKTIYLKNLKKCVINIGVVEGACFIDTLIDCELQLVAHQVRIHNSNNTTFRIFATSKPIIEHCTQVKFGQYSYTYDNLEKDLQDAGFSGRKNLWDQVQDFNWHKQDKSPNFDLI